MPQFSPQLSEFKGPVFATVHEKHAGESVGIALQQSQSGIVVMSVAKHSPFMGMIEVGDLLLKVNGMLVKEASAAAESIVEAEQLNLVVRAQRVVEYGIPQCTLHSMERLPQARAPPVFWRMATCALVVLSVALAGCLTLLWRVHSTEMSKMTLQLQELKKTHQALTSLSNRRCRQLHSQLTSSNMAADANAAERPRPRDACQCRNRTAVRPSRGSGHATNMTTQISSLLVHLLDESADGRSITNQSIDASVSYTHLTLPTICSV